MSRLRATTPCSLFYASPGRAQVSLAVRWAIFFKTLDTLRC